MAGLHSSTALSAATASLRSSCDLHVLSGFALECAVSHQRAWLFLFPHTDVQVFFVLSLERDVLPPLPHPPQSHSQEYMRVFCSNIWNIHFYLFVGISTVYILKVR